VDDKTDENGTRVGPAIYWAVKDGDLDVEVLLLAYGAKVPVYEGHEDVVLPECFTTVQMVKQQGGAMVRVIWQATKQQVGVTGN
jgi:hypothetical protein